MIGNKSSALAVRAHLSKRSPKEGANPAARDMALQLEQKTQNRGLGFWPFSGQLGGHKKVLTSAERERGGLLKVTACANLPRLPRNSRSVDLSLPCPKGSQRGACVNSFSCAVPSIASMSTRNHVPYPRLHCSFFFCACVCVCGRGFASANNPQTPPTTRL